MRTIYLLSVLLFLFTLSGATAQKSKYYKAWVTLTDNSEIRGALFNVSKDGLVLMDKNLRDTVASIDPIKLHILKLRRKGKVGTWVLIGTVSGLAIGAGIGALEDASSEGGGPFGSDANYGVYGGMILGPPVGALTGALIGSGKKTFEIRGNTDIYNSLLPELRRYAIKG